MTLFFQVLCTNAQIESLVLCVNFDWLETCNLVCPALLHVVGLPLADTHQLLAPVRDIDVSHRASMRAALTSLDSDELSPPSRLHRLDLDILALF